MMLKDAPIGARLLIDVKSTDYEIVSFANNSCGWVVGTKLITPYGYRGIAVGFRWFEKSANQLTACEENDLKIDPLIQYVNWFKPATICHLAKNRRYLA